MTDYGYENATPAGRARAVEQDLAVNAAADVVTPTPLLRSECRALGQHEIVYAGVARCGCASLNPTPQVEDDGGDHIVRQSGGLRRDRYQRVVR